MAFAFCAKDVVAALARKGTLIRGAALVSFAVAVIFNVLRS